MLFKEPSCFWLKHTRFACCSLVPPTMWGSCLKTQCRHTCHIFVLCRSFALYNLPIILQGYFTGTGAIRWLPQCQWRNLRIMDKYTKYITWTLQWTDDITTTKQGIVWWRHQMETFSTSLALCAGNSPVTGDFPAQRPVTRSFDVFVDLRLNKWLTKQSWGWWFETPSRP